VIEIVVRGANVVERCNGNVWKFPGSIDMDIIHLVARIAGVNSFTLKRGLHSTDR
jgi:hypothetical protein